MKRVLLVLFLACGAARAETINGDMTILGRWNATGATSVAYCKTGVLASRPTACTVGDCYFSTNSSAGRNVSVCTATGSPGTWNTQGDGTTLVGDTGGNLTSTILAIAGGAGVVTSGSGTTITVATASTEANFLASGALTCGASTQGKAQVHTTPLQYCDNAATPTLQYAAYGSSTGVATSATALAANGSNCSAGSFPLGVDASGASESCTALSSSNAGTATALAANGANCSAGNYPLGVDASGAAETCTADDDVPESGDFGNLTAGAGLTISAGTLATASQEAAFLADGGASALTCGASNQGKAQVMDNAVLQYCDGATTSVLRYSTLGDSAGNAAGLSTAGGTAGVSVFAASAPSTDQVLKATSSTVATWQADDDVPEAGDFTALSLTGAVTTSGGVATSPGKVDVMQTSMYCSDAGANDTYSCNLSPAATAYVTGTLYWFKANTANTGTATINFNSLGAKTIKKFTAVSPGADLADNDIRAGQWVPLIYDGTNMQIVSAVGVAPVTSVTGTTPIASSGGTTPAISIANAAADGSTKGAASFAAADFDASSGNITVDRAITGTFTGALTLTNTVNVDDADFTILDGAAGFAFDVSGSNKMTFAMNIASSDKIVTLQDATQTLVGRDTTDTLTNKTIDVEDTANAVTWIVEEPLVTMVQFGGVNNHNTNASGVTWVAPSGAALGQSNNWPSLGQLNWSATADNQAAYITALPSTWASSESTDLILYWRGSGAGTSCPVTECAAAPTCVVEWKVNVACATPSTDTADLGSLQETESTGTFAFTGANASNTFKVQAMTFTGLDTSGCAAGDLMYVYIRRGGSSSATDTYCGGTSTYATLLRYRVTQ